LPYIKLSFTYICNWLANYESHDDVAFRKFRRQLLQSSLVKILESLKPGMTTPEVVRFADDHFRKVVYGLGPYIADYPEQALLACIVQGWCPKYVFFYNIRIS
jgi:Plavaka transposase